LDGCEAIVAVESLMDFPRRFSQQQM